jgi:hypothetical protein
MHNSDFDFDVITGPSVPPSGKPPAPAPSPAPTQQSAPAPMPHRSR